MPAAPIEVKRERPPPPQPPPPPPPRTTAADIEKADAAVARADAHAVAARRRMEKAEAAVQQVMAKRMAAADIGHDLDVEAYSNLLADRAELEQQWEQLRASAAQLRREYGDADIALFDARTAAEEVRHDLAAEKAAAAREVEFKAIDERFRLERHRRLMEFYDTMSQEELRDYLQAQGRARSEVLDRDRPIRQPLASGPPRTYSLRGDPSTWQLPSPPPSPPDSPVAVAAGPAARPAAPAARPVAARAAGSASQWHHPVLEWRLAGFTNRAHKR